MCGILGVINESGTNKKIIEAATRQLFLLSESRGREASGFSYTKNKHIVTHRTSKTAHALIKQQEFEEAMAESRRMPGKFGIIGHSRLATNGSQYIDKNNQPVIGTEVVAVHNGVIVNAAMLWKKYFPKAKPPELDTQVVISILELFLRTATMRDALKKVYKEIEGEASIALFSRKPTSVYLATNTGSLYYTRTQSGIFIFSSERYITETTLKRTGEHGNIIQLTPGNVTEVLLTPDTSSLKTLQNKFKDVFLQNKLKNPLRILKNHEPNYTKIETIRRCTKCILPVTMPLIEFDSNGVCNFCNTYTKQRPLGKTALESYIAPFRTKNGEPDCIVALSGGRDSSYGLHYVKKVLGLNPIAYTYDWGMVTDIARRNQSRMVSALGVEHIWVSADIDYKRRNIKKNVEAWLAKPDIAMVPLFMAGDKQAEYYVEQLKKKTGIKLVIYCRGNQLEDERFKFGYYGIFDGTPKGVIHNLSWRGKMTMATYFAKACINNRRYINTSLVDTMFAFSSSYLMRHRDFLYLWHYILWDEREIVSTLKRNYGWETPADTIATWRIDDGTPPFYNYIYYHLQGFTEHDGLRSNQIREGHMTRTEALKLVQKENVPRYESLKWYFDVLRIDGHKALSVIDGMPTRY